VHTGFWRGNLREIDYLEDAALEGRTILKWIFKKWDRGTMDWIDLARDRDKWRTVVNAIISLRVP